MEPSGMAGEKNDLDVIRLGPLCRMVMQRMAKKNALNTNLYNGLIAAFQAADADRKIRVILLTAAGDTFTSGNDMDDFMKLRTGEQPRPGTGFISVISKARKPVVAAVNGLAIGIGSTMLLHCDLVFAAESARFQMPFVSLGLCPEAGSTYLLPRRLGHQRASEILLLGESFSAREAEAIGLVNRVYPDDELAEGSMAAARKLAARPPEAVMLTKRLLKEGGRRGLEEAIAEEGRRFTERLVSPEFEAAYASFKARSKG
jgi:enoyl-CoA hydratase/carnithine racemase